MLKERKGAMALETLVGIILIVIALVVLLKFYDVLRKGIESFLSWG